MALRREFLLNELVDGREMAEPEAEGRLWLGYVSVIVVVGHIIDIPVHRERVDACIV